MATAESNPERARPPVPPGSVPGQGRSSSFGGAIRYLFLESLTVTVATRLARGRIPSQGSVLAIPSRSPSLRVHSAPKQVVSLRPMKELVEHLEPSHPFRILLLGEPDQISRQEYAAKVVGWYRLIMTRAGSGTT